MPTDVLMPELSPGMEKGNVVRWLKRIGESVRPGEVLLEVETDKATVEIEAHVDGTLTEILIREGATDVHIHQRLGVIVDANNGVVTRDPLEADPGRAAGPPSIGAWLASPKQAGHDDRVFASPIARRLMKESSVDPRILVGTGPNGRIVEGDVRAATKRAEGVRESAPIVERSTAVMHRAFRDGRYETVPHDAMRKTIARRLTEAKRTIPHFYVAIDCRLDRLLQLRETLNRGHDAADVRLSVNDFLIKALARALIRTPDANVSFTDDVMIRHRHADISVAVATPGGLMTPVIKDAETKPILAISAEMKEMRQRAQIRRLSPEEYEGGTAGLSNLGMFGVRDFAAILNPPLATMLAIGAAERRPVVVDDTQVTIATVCTATLSVDHRAVDGAVAAQLLSEFKSLVETPVSLLV